MKTKKGDFVELQFVGRLDDGKVFDLNDKEVAKKEGINSKLDRVIVCIGEGDIVQGLDEELTDKEIGNKFNVNVSAEKAFGKREAKLLQLVNANKFKDQQVRPYPGLQLNIDGRIGIVKTVSGGRVMIDFNNPLAGRDLKYEAVVLKIVDDVNEKIKFSLKNLLGNVIFEFKEGKLSLKTKLPAELKGLLEEKLKNRIKEIKEIEYTK